MGWGLGLPEDERQTQPGSLWKATERLGRKADTGALFTFLMGPEAGNSLLSFPMFLSF